MRYVTDVKKISAPTKEALARTLFPVHDDPEILAHVERHAFLSEEGWTLLRPQIIAVIGWAPSEIDWDDMARLGADW